MLQNAIIDSFKVYWIDISLCAKKKMVLEIIMVLL